MESASKELTITKTLLTSALFRPDPVSCPRNDIESTLALLNSTIAECSPTNVQRCKKWALDNLIPSTNRISNFCKYLVALSKSIGQDKDVTAQSARNRVPSARRRRLHILYILNDLLHHVKYRNRDDGFAQKLEPAMPALFKSAASFNNCPKHIRKLRDLINLWEENQYFSKGHVQELREAVEAPGDEGTANGTEQAVSPADGAARSAKSAPFIMPAMHGDPSVPWYDLPAGNWLPHLQKNSTKPINPSVIKPLELAKGPADQNLVEAVKSLLLDIDKIYSNEADFDDTPRDIGQMGEVVEIDEITGDIIGGDTYYGWSRQFCKNMKARKRNGGRQNERDDDRGRGRTRSSRSYSQSPSRSRSRSRRRRNHSISSRSSDRPALKRQRVSESPRDSRSRSGRRGRDGSRSRSRSYTDRSQSRSQSRSSRGARLRTRRSRSYSRSRSRSRSLARSRNRSKSSRSPTGSYPKSSSYSPPPQRDRSRRRSPPSRQPYDSQPQPHFQQLPPQSGFVPPPPNFQIGNFPPQVPGFPGSSSPMPPNFPQGGFPITIPPPNFHGAWPPPPPPGGQRQQFFPGVPPPPPPPPGGPGMGFQGGWGSRGGHVPPPPPPPPSGPPTGPQDYYQNGWNQQGRGGGHNNGEYNKGGGGSRGGNNRGGYGGQQQKRW